MVATGSALSDVSPILSLLSIPAVGVATYLATLALVDRRRLMAVYHTFRAQS
jgi:hypothetical protein